MPDLNLSSVPGWSAFRTPKKEQPATAPSNGSGNGNGNGAAGGPHNGTNGSGGSNGSNGKGPVAKAAEVAARLQAAVVTQRSSEKDEEQPYDIVLESVKDHLTKARKLNPAAFDHATDADRAVVYDAAREAINEYNSTSGTRGLAPLVDLSEGAELTNEVERIARRMVDDVLGWGPIANYMDDPMVEEIFINGHRNIYVKRAGEETKKTQNQFRSAFALRNFINGKLDYGAGGRAVTMQRPYRDHRLVDGSRIHVIMDPLVSNLGETGMAVTIRRFRSVARSLNDLIRLGSITNRSATLLRACVKAQLNICISGGTGTGKTTFLTALTSEIDPNADERVVTVEDTPELDLNFLPNWVALISREKSESAEVVSMADNVRHCLRMRPKRILLGEARGPEMIAILEAMNTGHDGCMFTVHADDAEKSITRMETLYLKGGLGNVPLLAIRREISSAVNLVINITNTRMPSGKEYRRVNEIMYLPGGVEGEQPRRELLFKLERPGGPDDERMKLTYQDARPMHLVKRLEERVKGFNWHRDIEQAKDD